MPIFRSRHQAALLAWLFTPRARVHPHGARLSARYHGTPGPPPNDVDVLVVGILERADLYDAADRAQARLGMQVNPVIRTPQQWADEADSLILQIKTSPTVDVTPARKAAS